MEDQLGPTRDRCIHCSICRYLLSLTIPAEVSGQRSSYYALVLGDGRPHGQVSHLMYNRTV